MIPAQVRYDPNATPPQFTDNEDYRVEPGTHIRVKIMGTRSEVGEMWAIGTINEDYLGYFESRLFLRLQWCANRLFLDLSALECPSGRPPSPEAPRDYLGLWGDVLDGGVLRRQRAQSLPCRAALFRGFYTQG